MKKKFKIAIVASEVFPFSKTGGLADVTGSLPKNFSEMEHEVIIITPLYEKIIDQKKNNLKQIEKDFFIRTSKKHKSKISLWQ
jgi:starch synthase